MLYTKNLTPTELSNNFAKALAAESAILRLIANLGVIRFSDVSRVFRPQDKAWHLEVETRAKGYLAFIYANCERARKFRPDAAVLEALGPPPLLAASEEKKLLKSGAPARLIPVETKTFVELTTGLKSTRINKAALPVLKVHWVRARSLAADRASRGAMVMTTRVLKRLVTNGLLDVARGGNGELVYSLSSNGAMCIGGRYQATSAKSTTQSAHKTLARGYLLHAVCDATDGWSEGSLFSKELLPGVKGTPGMLSHEKLSIGYSGTRRAGSGGKHPVDGLVLKHSETEGLYENWKVELIEAERGNKPSSDFIKSLYLLLYGLDPNTGIEKTLVVKGKVVVRKFFVTKLTYVMDSEEFITPILRACRQFATGTKADENGFWVPEKGLKFAGSGSWAGTCSDPDQGRWEELLSMVHIAFCPLSSVRQNFLGVSYTCCLQDLAKQRGLLDYRKVR